MFFFIKYYVFLSYYDFFPLKVRLTGLEPARREHQILSLARLPIPPQARIDEVGAKLHKTFHSAKSFRANSINVSRPLAKSASV